MFGHLRHLVPATTAFLGVAAMVWAGPGYLPTVGPVPLRFRPLPQVPVVSTNASAQAPAPAPISFVDLPEEAPQTNTFEEAPSTPVVVPQGSPYTAEAQSPEPQQSAPAEPVISPEMLVKYFAQPSPTTNSANVAGQTPQAGFTPPIVEPKSSSRDLP
jgi:hypothetical protein